MATDFHERARRLLDQAVARPPPQRESFLRGACGANEHLFEEVWSLLPHYVQMETFEPARPGGSLWKLPGTTTFLRVGEGDPDAADPTPPFCFGPYKVDRVLGRGGMGVVYRAEHATLRRRVAIKVLRRAQLTDQDRQRFAVEVEILRWLNHPGIARMYYADTIGSVFSDQPYFVMEYVDGSSLTRYAAAWELDTRERLALFVQVCGAIEFAHSRSIVHRDLKPDNVLVLDAPGAPRSRRRRGSAPAAPRVKVVDFGVARILQSTVSGDERGRFIGTPAYASPEQLAGESDRLTPRSDVYSLGLVLHELLTGSLPHWTGGRVRLALERVWLEPERARVEAMEAEFRYYLQVLLARALARSPEKRFTSAGPFGAEVECLLAAYPALRGWSRLTRRLREMFSPRRSAAPSAVSGPLSAVLRTRVENAMKTYRLDAQARSRPRPRL